jgi:hypothetical protein
LVLVCAALLCSLVSAHLSLLPEVGHGDRYTPPDFRLLPRHVQVARLLRSMYAYNSGLTHQSKWWEWPIWRAAPTVLDSGTQHSGRSCGQRGTSPVPDGGQRSALAGGGQWALGYFAAYAPLTLVKRCMWT